MNALRLKRICMQVCVEVLCSYCEHGNAGFSVIFICFHMKKSCTYSNNHVIIHSVPIGTTENSSSNHKKSFQLNLCKTATIPSIAERNHVLLQLTKILRMSSKIFYKRLLYINIHR